MVLLILGDYYDDERDYAWPSQATLAADCQIPERTIRFHLANLETDGFITCIQKGNQYRRSRYQLHFAVTAPSCEPAMGVQPVADAQESEPAISEPAMVASASEPAISDRVNRQSGASEPATPRMTRDQEGTIEETSIQGADTAPEWWGTLDRIEGFKTAPAHAVAWLQGKGITEKRALETALALVSKWPGPPKNPYRDPWATFQNWVIRPPLSNNGSRAAASAGDRTTEELKAGWNR
tara:strand:- start:86 stop:799 length:714 start_codon:yes stop_codon:yes gene_type:complete